MKECSPCSSRLPLLLRPGKGADIAHAMLDLEDVVVEAGDPLLSLRRQLEIAERRLDVGLHAAPEEIGVLVDKIGGALVIQLFRQADLHELVIERVDLAVIE